MRPSEDQDILDELVYAYNTTRLDMDVCVQKTNEYDCKSLQFRGQSRCQYEKKWFSYIRGGNCFIDKNVIEQILDNLDSFLIIRWSPLNIKVVGDITDNLPNPDNLSKIDMINILHDLTYHTKDLIIGGDIIALLESQHDLSLSQFNQEDLLYYVYLFSFITYATQFLVEVDLVRFFATVNLTRLRELITNPPSKSNLVDLFLYFAKTLPPKTPKSSKTSSPTKERLKKISKASLEKTKKIAVPVGKVIVEKAIQTATNWAFGIIFGTILSLLVYKNLPAQIAIETIKKIAETPDLKTMFSEAIRLSSNKTFNPFIK